MLALKVFAPKIKDSHFWFYADSFQILRNFMYLPGCVSSETIISTFPTIWLVFRLDGQK